MKKGFKQISLILAVIMTVCIFAVPGSVMANSYAFDMNELGITAGMNPETRESEYVKRDEFAQMVTNMISQQDVANALSDARYFTDIASSPYKGAVNLLANLGYISGSGGGAYMPDGYLTYGAACKILVHALGYDKIVTDSSLDAYQYVAGDIKLTKDVDSSQQYMTFAQTMLMIHNALDIGLMVPVYYNANIAPSYQVDEYRTYRSMLYGRTGTGIVKMRGTVTADASTYMYDAVPNIKDTQLQIEGKIYNYNGKAPLGFVGQIVDFYITREDYVEGKITSIEPINKNIVYDFGGTQVKKATKDKITFSLDGIESDVKLDKSTRFIYNNRLELGYIMSQSKINDNIVIRTVDNDADGTAELLYIYEYQNCVVEAVYAESDTISLKNGYTLGNIKNVTLDEEKIYYEIFDEKGNFIEISQIPEDAVVSIAKSIKGDSIRIVLCTNYVEGAIVSRNMDELVIGDKVYLCAETIDLNDINIGAQVKAYLNFLGKVVYYEEIEADKNYAYVYMYGAPSGLGNYKVKLLMPASVSVKEVDGETDEMSGEVSTSKSLFVRNSDVVVYEAEEDIILDGTKRSASAVLNVVIDTPVSYAVNNNGRIYKIDTLEAIDDIKISENEEINLYNKKYNGTELIFGGGKGDAFAIEQDKTMAFCVPKYTEDGQTKSDLSDDDLMVMVELRTNVGYEANGYEQNDDTLISEVLVVQQIMKSGQSGSVTDTSDVGMVVKASRKLDKDGNEVVAVTMLTDGEEKSFIVSPLISNQKAFERLNKGDLIAYTLDPFDQLNGVKVLQDVNSYYEDNEPDYLCAQIKDMQYNQLSNAKVRWVHNIMVGYENQDVTIRTIELLARTPAPIFIIDGDDKFSVGSVTDLQIGDKICAILTLDKIRAIVIKR